MKDKKNTTTEATKTARCRKPAYGYKVVYVSLPEGDYEAVVASARANCRSVGGELLYGWRMSNGQKAH